mgnify:CR=1 FL=1
MSRAVLRHDGDTFPIDLADLRDDVRAGRLPGSAELHYEPWTGVDYIALSALPQLAEDLDAPDARLVASLSRFRWPWMATLVSLGILVVAVLQFRGALPAVVYDSERAERYAVGWESILFGQAWWTHLSSQLIHAGPMHVFGNLIAIAVSGWRVERALGATAYLVVCLASVLLGAALVVLICPLPVVGSSTLGFGLLGAHVAIGFRYGDVLPPRMRGKYGFGVLPVLLLILLPNLTLPAVAHSAHLGGLVGGGVAALAVRPDTTAGRTAQGPRRLLNLGIAALLALAPAAITPLVVAFPAPLHGWSEEVEIEGTGVTLRLPWRVARNEGVLLNAAAWSTSPSSPDVLFGGLNRARAVHDAARLARTWERGAQLDPAPTPEPLGAGWVATAFTRSPRLGDVFPPEYVVEHQQLRGSTLLRVGYVVRLDANGLPGPRAAFFEQILRTAELGDPPKLARARAKFSEFPEIGDNRQEFGRQLYLVGAWVEAERVLAPLIDPADIRGSDALRVRLDIWARHPDAVQVAWPDGPDGDWLVAVLEASVSQRFYQDRGIRALAHLGRCDDADRGLAAFAARRPDAPEVPDLRLMVEGCVPAAGPDDPGGEGDPGEH